MRPILFAPVLAGATILAPGGAFAQADLAAFYKGKTIEMIVGYAAGSSNDIAARAVARNIGWKRAMELLLTGQPTDARTAQAWGLVNRVVPAEALDAEVRRFTDLIVAHSAATIALGKRTFYRQIGESLEAAYGVASEAMACNMGYEDAAAGIEAFLGRRRTD